MSDTTNTMVTTDEVVGVLNRMSSGEEVQFNKEHAVALIKTGLFLGNAPLPYELQKETTTEGQLRAISNLFTVRKYKNEKELIESIDNLFNNLQEDELEYVLTSIRGVIFDSLHMTNDGFRCDAKQEIAENPDFSSNGKKIAPWNDVDYFNPTTGKRITEDAYKALSQKEQNDYEVRRILSLDNDGFSQNIDQCNTPWVSRGIAKDIEIHPAMAYRYICETCAAYQGHIDSGLVYEHRSVIAEAITKLGILEFAKGKNLERSVVQGIIKSRWHLDIAVLTTLYCEYREADLATISDDDIDRYLDLVEKFAGLNSVLPDDELKIYRDASGDPLPGVDKDNNPIKAPNATLEQQRDGLRFMAEELLMRLHNNFGGRKDVRTNTVIKRLAKLYFELICNE